MGVATSLLEQSDTGGMPMSRSTVRIVPRKTEGGDESLGTAGLARFEAFDDEGRWIGYTTTVPGVMSGWHHHGEHDTYVYMITGTIDLEFGADGQERASAVAGDFVCIPAGAIHREGTPPGDPAEAVVVRIGTGPTVFNVDGPGE